MQYQVYLSSQNHARTTYAPPPCRRENYISCYYLKTYRLLAVL